MFTEQQYTTLLDLIQDPFNGPYEGEDFHIEDDGTIHVVENNIRMAAMIMRRINTSDLFSSPLVKVGLRGGAIILDFDSVFHTEPVFVNRIGPGRATLAEVKESAEGKFFVYLDKKRCVKEFKRLSQAKTYITRTDKTLQRELAAVNTDDWSDD